MCGRYVRRSDKQKIAELFAIHGPVIPDLFPLDSCPLTGNLPARVLRNQPSHRALFINDLYVVTN
jgi:hypothetical protein